MMTLPGDLLPTNDTVELYRRIDRKEDEATHAKVVDTLAMIRERNTDEKAAKMTRARDRIETENRARVEKVLSAMSFARSDVASSLEKAPVHFRRLLDTFLRPGFSRAFLIYAGKVRRGVIAKGTVKSTSTVSARPPAPNPPKTTASSGLFPPRRAISLDYPEMCPKCPANAAGKPPPLANDVEKRRHANFGNVVPTASAGSQMTTKKKSDTVVDGGSGGGREKFSSQRRGKRKSQSGPGKKQWRTHSDDAGVDLTLTPSTAAGRVSEVPSYRVHVGGTGENPTVPAVDGSRSKAGTSARGMPIERLKEQLQELVEHEVGSE